MPPTSSPPAGESTARESVRARLYRIIFEAETPAGKLFDEVLLVLIVLSVVAVMLESVAPIRQQWYPQLKVAEWIFTVLFTIEYGLRLYSARNALRYARSFFGVVDLLAVLPSYLALLLPGGQYVMVVRMLRLLRMFRILKMVRYVGEGNVLLTALRASRPKIIIFLLAVFIVTTVLGTLLYLVEGPTHGFDSIPRSVYWAIVTVTTVGYGDISPATPLGQFISAFGMLTGYAIIAVPTGIMGMELSRASAQEQRKITSERECKRCGQREHRRDARYCDRCGEQMG
ncbi:MAG: ion transporter [Verrucomicrobiota bacterium]